MSRLSELFKEEQRSKARRNMREVKRNRSSKRNIREGRDDDIIELTRWEYEKLLKHNESSEKIFYELLEAATKSKNLLKNVIEGKNITSIISNFLNDAEIFDDVRQRMKRKGIKV